MGASLLAMAKSLYITDYSVTEAINSTLLIIFTPSYPRKLILILRT